MNYMRIKIFSLLLLNLPIFLFANAPKKTGEFYQITVYHFSSAEQLQLTEQYLKDAYLPALHSMQITNVGVFTALANDTSTDKRIYVIMPVKSMQTVLELNELLAKNNEYQSNEGIPGCCIYYTSLQQDGKNSAESFSAGAFFNPSN